jgi:hypothetical protein
VDLTQQTVDEQLSGQTGVLGNGRQGWVGERCNRKVIEPDDGDISRNVDTASLQGPDRAYRDQVAGSDDSVKIQSASKELRGCGVT